MLVGIASLPMRAHSIPAAKGCYSRSVLEGCTEAVPGTSTPSALTDVRPRTVMLVLAFSRVLLAHLRRNAQINEPVCDPFAPIRHIRKIDRTELLSVKDV